ncbi:MAG: Hsp70 family protein, partial [Bacteroidales bacterium]|nr:Hsp70 family protein [Bacteroidales bacterium]
PPDAEEKTFTIPAVITVPAYFGDLQRHETRIAGYAAGLNVIAIINEPTAAALAYGTNIIENKKILVFDLGGGTFDVTILKIHEGEAEVMASDGADQLGGKDWDDIIINYLYTKYEEETGEEIPDDMGWEIQQKAVQAKIELSECDDTIVIISGEDKDAEITLHRKNTSSDPDNEFSFESDFERPFYFEERSSNLLSLCRAICTRVLNKANLSWGDINDIVLAGGSCRMPMIPEMLEEMSGEVIKRNIPGFNYDTAIAIGAALYGRNRQIVKDVTSKTVGVEVKFNGKPYIEQLIGKNEQLTVPVQESFKAERNPVLKVYEGDSHLPDECIMRGRLELENPEGSVTVKMEINTDGVLTSVVEIPPDTKKKLHIKTDNGEMNKIELKSKIVEIRINL